MTAEDIRKEKYTLQKEILKLIESFEENNPGAYVNSIYLTHSVSVGGSHETVAVDAEIMIQ